MGFPGVWDRKLLACYGFLFSVVLLYFHKTWRNSAFGGDGGILAHLVERNFLVVGGE